MSCVKRTDMDHSVWKRGAPQQGLLPFSAVAFGNRHRGSNRHIFLFRARRCEGMLLDSEQFVDLLSAQF